MIQLSMFDLLEPKPAPARYEPPPRREIATRAYGKEGYLISVGMDDPDPVEVEIRDIPCLIVWSYGGVSTYTMQPAGSLFWSGTGYRSMSSDPRCTSVSVADTIALVEDYIDRPIKKDGLGGKLERWWPLYVDQWRQGLSYHGTAKREGYWGMCASEEDQAARWARFDAEQAEALDRMRAEGIDPNDVGPPRGHKGKWPRIEA